MEIQIRTSKLTAEQEAQIDVYYNAAAILRVAGISVKVREIVCSPGENPAIIEVEKEEP